MADAVSPQQVERLIAELERLCRHVGALQRDVQILAGRIVPYEDEDLSKPGAPAWHDHAMIAHPGPVTLASLAAVVKQADSQLRGAESDIRIIRIKVEDTSNAADWREWVRDASETRERGRK